MAFANDMNLIADTPLGLQALINHGLPAAVWNEDQAKSNTISIVGLGKEKKAVVDDS